MKNGRLTTDTIDTISSGASHCPYPLPEYLRYLCFEMIDLESEIFENHCLQCEACLQGLGEALDIYERQRCGEIFERVFDEGIADL